MAKVLNFGSLNIDFVYDVSHFVRPGETLQCNDLSIFCGGKGLNQSIAAAKSGCDTYHAGCIGIDDGQILIDMLKSNNVNTDYIKRVSTRTGNAIIQVDKNGQNCILLYGGANQQITIDQIDFVLESFCNKDYLLIQNEINNLEYLILSASKKGMKIIFNPAPFDQSILNLPLHLINYLVVNEVEGADMVQISTEDYCLIMNELKNRYPNTKILLTLGKNGVMYYDGDIIHQHGVYPVNIVDTTAAGDTFIGYFLSGLLQGFGSKEILAFASKASSITISRKGASVSIPTLQEVSCIQY